MRQIYNLEITSKLQENELAEKIVRSDVCLSDLDDTDAESPAKVMVFSRMRRLSSIDPIFISWGIKSLYDLFTGGKKSEDKCWREYIKVLDGDSRKEADEMFSQEAVIDLLVYPGVRDLYGLMENAKKVYVTRNIIEIAGRFAKNLGLDGVIAETFDKEKSTAEFIENNPELKRYFIKGDSKEDEGMIDVAMHYKKKGYIDEVVSCYRADSLRNENQLFDVNVIKDYTGLVNLINSCLYSQ